MKKWYGKHFMKQKMMRKVLTALAPVVAASVGFFGFRSLLVTGVSLLFACLAEWLFVRRGSGRISEAVLVTAVIFALSMPPRIPLWIVAVGVTFGVVFGKMVFGGFGTNLFNPAIVGRAFVYISFSEPVNARWTGAFEGFPGGFAAWLGPDIDSLTRATPLLAFKNAGEVLPHWRLLAGNVSGSLGETSGLLLLLAAAYLVWTKTADWRFMAGMAGGFTALTVFLNLVVPGLLPDPLYSLLAGSFLFTMVFIVTEPISGAKTSKGKLIYGILVGAVAVLIRGLGLFTEGTTFAILVGNTFAPLIDEAVRFLDERRKRVKTA